MSYVCLRFPFFELFINEFIYSISLQSFLFNSFPNCLLPRKFIFFFSFFNTAQTSHLQLAIHVLPIGFARLYITIEHKTFLRDFSYILFVFIFKLFLPPRVASFFFFPSFSFIHFFLMGYNNNCVLFLIHTKDILTSPYF